MDKSVNRKRQAYLLMFLCWLVYSTSYLGKVNYAANITQIIDYYGITKAQAGSVSTFFFFLPNPHVRNCYIVFYDFFIVI